MHILWRFSSLFHLVTPSRNRLNCSRNKVNMKEILSNLFSTFKSIRQNSSYLKKEFKIKKNYSEKYTETLSIMTSPLIKPTVYVSLSMRYILLFVMLYINNLSIVFFIMRIRRTFFLNARKFNKQPQQQQNIFFRKFLGFALINCNP